MAHPPGGSVLTVGNSVKTILSRAVRTGVTASPCCPDFFVQARDCDGGGLVDQWFTYDNLTGAVLTASGNFFTPFFYKLIPDDGHTYFVRDDTTECTHGTIQTGFIEEVKSCCNCSPCADSTPSAYHLDTLDSVEFADKFMIWSGISFPIAALTLSNPSFVNDLLADTPLCMSYRMFVDQNGEIFCEWHGERDINDEATDAVDVARVKITEASFTGDLTTSGVEAEVVEARIVADLAKRPDQTFGLVVRVGIDIREVADPMALAYGFEITYFTSLLPTDPIADCDTLSLANSTIWQGYNPAVVIGGPLENYVYGGGGIFFGRMIGGKNGTAELSPADGEHCGFVPQYRATLVGSTPSCEQHGAGPFSYGGKSVTMDFTKDVSLGINDFPGVKFADVYAYADGDCMSTPDHTVADVDLDPSGVDLGGTFLDGGTAQVNIREGSRSMWQSETKEITCNDDLVGGYPRTITFSFDPAAEGNNVYHGGTLVLELINTP